MCRMLHVCGRTIPTRRTLVQAMYCTVTFLPEKEQVKVATSPMRTGASGSTCTECSHCAAARRAANTSGSTQAISPHEHAVKV